jgi:hypothetical protein
VGVEPGDSYGVVDLVTGEQYRWTDRNCVRLDPVHAEPAHLFRVVRQS